jgi:hypothetical protein
MLDDGHHLGCIGGKVKVGFHVGKAIVGIEIVDTYEAISIGCLYNSGTEKETNQNGRCYQPTCL